MPLSHSFFLALVLPSLFFVLSAALACPSGQPWECTSVSNNYNYVACVNNQCVCRTGLGFTGAATTSSKCDCGSGLSVYWSEGNPYCISYPDAVQYRADLARDDILKGKVQQLYASIAWPNSVGWAGAIATGNVVGSYFDLFAHDVKGVIDPLGTVSGFEGTAEYFVGQVWTGISRVVAAPFNKILASGNVVYIDVDINFAQFSTPTATIPYYLYNLTQSGTFTFDSDNKIIGVDLVIRNVQLATAPLNPQTDEFLAGICNVILTNAHCNSTFDPAGYYTSAEDCLNHLKSIPFGTWDDVRQNTAICRLYHSTLAILRPDIHCPHTGKTGGGKCVLHTAAEYYTNPNIRY